MPGPEAITPWLDKVRELEKSPRSARTSKRWPGPTPCWKKRPGPCYPREKRPLLGRRLLIMAYYLELGQRPDDARVARIVAEDLLHPEPTALGGENPFLLGLVKMSLGLAWQESQQPRRPANPAAC